MTYDYDTDTDAATAPDTDTDADAGILIRTLILIPILILIRMPLAATQPIEKLLSKMVLGGQAASSLWENHQFRWGAELAT